MLFNVSKCKVMHVGTMQFEKQCPMNDQKLELITQEKGLGVVISNDLKVSQQCQQAYNRGSRMLGLLHRTIQYKHTDILLHLYKSLVRPHLEYCVPAWSPHYKKDKILIEKVQRRFTKMIPSVKLLPYEDRLKQLNLRSLKDR